MPWSKTIPIPAEVQAEVDAVLVANKAESAVEEKIMEWREADTNQRAWRELELKLRAEVIAACFDASKESGTENKDLGNGWKLQVTKSLDYKLKTDHVALDTIAEQIGDAAFDMVVSYDPKLSVSNFKKLAPEQQTLFSELLTVKPSSPQLKLVEPK
jgi:hypothetical protein